MNKPYTFNRNLKVRVLFLPVSLIAMSILLPALGGVGIRLEVALSPMSRSDNLGDRRTGSEAVEMRSSRSRDVVWRREVLRGVDVTSGRREFRLEVLVVILFSFSSQHEEVKFLKVQICQNNSKNCFLFDEIFCFYLGFESKVIAVKIAL